MPETIRIFDGARSGSTRSDCQPHKQSNSECQSEALELWAGRNAVLCVSYEVVAVEIQEIVLPSQKRLRSGHYATLLVEIARFATREGHRQVSRKNLKQHPANDTAHVVVNDPCSSVLVIADKDSSVLFPEWSWPLDDVAHEKQHANILHPNLTSRFPNDSPALGGRRGGNLRADCIKNLASRFLDVLKAGRQELRVPLVELNVVLRR